MDIQQIQYFLEVVQSGNFSAAAENLYTTQSSVSKNIKSLEKELDVQLFDRSKCQIQLTEAGKGALNHGISLLMQHAAQRLHYPGVVIIPLKEEFTSTFTLACNDYRHLSPAGKSFWNYISGQVSHSL